MKSNKIHTALISLLILFSCSDSFTDITSENDLTTDNFYQTADDFNTAVLGAYAKLQGQVGIYFELVEWRSDNLDLLAPTAGTQDRFNINKFQETSANQLITSAWDNFYNGIYRCNVITDNITNIVFDEVLKKQYEAEARFIRALTYFNIVRFWGDAPLVLNLVSVEESLRIGRSPIAEVYNVIESDLTYAMNNLPTSYPAQDFGRVTQGAAKTLLGKVYLTQNRYDDAVNILNQVVDQYSMMGDIVDVFDTENKNNSEIIFSIRFNKNIQSEDHGLWFGISDISTTPFTPKLLSAYEPFDRRLSLIDYQPIGSLLVPGKFFDTESSFRSFGNDYILLRYADVLLMLAEALNQQGYEASGSAFNYLNAVRERSGLESLTPTELPNQDDFKEAVLKERFLEFPLEGHRWFDLTRTNTAATQINIGIGVNIQNYQLLYPVPQTEIQKINNSIIFYQNEGY